MSYKRCRSRRRTTEAHGPELIIKVLKSAVEPRVQEGTGADLLMSLVHFL